jgi:hypothetical protein
MSETQVTFVNEAPAGASLMENSIFFKKFKI